MKTPLLTLTLTLILALIFFPESSTSFGSGSPGGKTNSPTDASNCTSCHSGTINSGSGSIEISSNIPASGYVPGETYVVEITQEHPSFSKFGFEITAEGGIGVNPKVGGFGTTNNETQSISSNTAVTHTASGTSGSASTGGFAKTWTINWEAPPAGSGDITFYFTGLSANGNSQNTGDEVYANSRIVSEEVSLEVKDLNKKNILFNTETKIVELTKESTVEVYSLSGKLILSSNNRYTSLANLSKGFYLLRSQEDSRIIVIN